VCLLPKPLGNLQGVGFQILPPGHFIAGLMQLPMMTAAEGYGELVADFETEGSGLCETQVRLGSAMARTLLSICVGTRPGEAGTIEVSADGRTSRLRRP
jgi:hypothetical protein